MTFTNPTRFTPEQIREYAASCDAEFDRDQDGKSAIGNALRQSADDAERLAAAEADAERYRWLRQRMAVRKEMNMNGDALDTLAMRPGMGFLKSTIDPAKGWTMPIFFVEHCEKVDRAIDAARNPTKEG